MDVLHRLDVAEHRLDTERLWQEALERQVATATRLHERVMTTDKPVALAQLATASTRADAEVMDRTRGKAVQPNLNATLDDIARLSDEELDARIAQVDRDLARLEGRKTQPASEG